MNIIEFFKSKFKKEVKIEENNIQVVNDNIKRFILRKYTPYTGIEVFYECIIDLDKNEVTTRILDNVPVNEEVREFDEFVKSTSFESDIYKSIGKTDDIHEKKYKDDSRFFYLADLYEINKDRMRKDSLDKYEEVKNMLMDRCNSLRINIETDNQKIFDSIIDEVNSHEVESGKKFGLGRESYVDFCKTRDSIDTEVEKEINGKYDSSKFAYAKRYIINYFYDFIVDYSFLLDILDKENVTDKEKETIRKYTELFSCLNIFMDKLDYLDTSADKVSIAKIEKNKSRLESNDKFIDEMNNLFSKVDSEKEDLYIHATTSLEGAKTILQNGLYSFSEDLSSFSYPYLNYEQIFTYEYGSELNKVGEAIILFRLPKDTHELVRLSEEEAKEAMGMMNMRRNIIAAPSYKVKSEDILGIIDKKNMRVINNEKFKEFSNSIKMV